MAHSARITRIGHLRQVLSQADARARAGRVRPVGPAAVRRRRDRVSSAGRVALLAASELPEPFRGVIRAERVPQLCAERSRSRRPGGRRCGRLTLVVLRGGHDPGSTRMLQAERRAPPLLSPQLGRVEQPGGLAGIEDRGGQRHDVGNDGGEVLVGGGAGVEGLKAGQGEEQAECCCAVKATPR
jgi:hypothetical protein